jgi:hypothetical protein
MASIITDKQWSNKKPYSTKLKQWILQKKGLTTRTLTIGSKGLQSMLPNFGGIEHTRWLASGWLHPTFSKSITSIWIGNILREGQQRLVACIAMMA